ncbi:PREDICTED: centriole, cilia and spindle-associated protein-like [Priapulus caudatus]|uniref:Centriole, cilia and spindle-associated protein-like n=1 Tax=Priapulus caudatus TaxID=37621 RepID=A0ABM1EJU7_PRICU|nr:PREDICTED: centriole, cilia and spindle-associated protein-like [Priapulus caudatus]
MVHRKTEYCKKYRYPLPDSVYDAYKTLMRYRAERRRLEHQHVPLPWEYTELAHSNSSSGDSEQFANVAPSNGPLKAWYKPPSVASDPGMAAKPRVAMAAKPRVAMATEELARWQSHATQTSKHGGRGSPARRDQATRTYDGVARERDPPTREVAVQTPERWHIRDADDDVDDNKDDDDDLRCRRGREVVRRLDYENGDECCQPRSMHRVRPSSAPRERTRSVRSVSRPRSAVHERKCPHTPQTPLFLPYAASGEQASVTGDQKTYNVYADTKDIHKAALRAQKRRASQRQEGTRPRSASAVDDRRRHGAAWNENLSSIWQPIRRQSEYQSRFSAYNGHTWR